MPWDPLGDGVGWPAVDPVDPEPQAERASSALKAVAATDVATDRVIDPPPRRPPFSHVNRRIQVARANRESSAPGDFGIAPTTTRGTTWRVVVGRLSKPLCPL